MMINAVFVMFQDGEVSEVEPHGPAWQVLESA